MCKNKTILSFIKSFCFIVVLQLFHVDAFCYPEVYLVGTMSDWEKQTAWKMQTSDGITYTLEDIEIDDKQELCVVEVDNGLETIYGSGSYGFGWLGPVYVYGPRGNIYLELTDDVRKNSFNIPLRIEDHSYDKISYEIIYSYEDKKIEVLDNTDYISWWNSEAYEGVFVLSDANDGDIFSASYLLHFWETSLNPRGDRWIGVVGTEEKPASRIMLSTNVDDLESFEAHALHFDSTTFSGNRVQGSFEGGGTWIELPSPGVWFLELSSDLTLYNDRYPDYYYKAPTFNLNGNNLTIDGVRDIYYAVGDAHPANYKVQKKYENPIQLTDNSKIRAISIDNVLYLVSGHTTAPTQVSSFTPSLNCDAPIFRIDDNQHVVITSSNSDAEIHYTLDGSVPTETSTLYTAPIVLPDYTVTVSAIACATRLNQSEVSTFVAAEHVLSKPNITVSDNRVTIDVEDDATIYYTTDGTVPTGRSAIYTAPLVIDHSCTIKAIAAKSGMFDSEVASADVVIPVILPKIPDVHADYNGRYVTLETEVDSATIFYTLDGSDPTDSSAIYADTFDVGGIVTVKAKAMKTGYNDSETLTLVIPAYYDGESATVGIEGNLAVAFGWTDTNTITSLTVRGRLGDADWDCLKGMTSLTHLDLSETECESIKANALANTSIVSVSMPRKVGSVGSRIFSGCANLAAVEWNASIALDSQAMEGVSNPNLMLYVGSSGLVPSSVSNVVVNGIATNIEITDGNPLFFPLPFHAESVSYTHSYTQSTPMAGCAGWETLALPFDVQTITHESKGRLMPFGTELADCKPFWLYGMGDGGFVAQSRIEANTPYIVSFPNNEAYLNDYNVSGSITFTANDCDVKATTLHPIHGPQVDFVPTYMGVAKSDNVYALNVHDPVSVPGSTFVAGLADIQPFGCYLTSSVTGQRMPSLSLSTLFTESISALPQLPYRDSLWSVYVQGYVLYIGTSVEQHIEIYNIDGKVVRTPHLYPGVNTITDLPSGIYIVNSTKVVIMR